MFGRITRSVMALAVITAFFVTTGPAGAQSGGATPEDLTSRAEALEADLQRQEAALDRKVGELTEAGSRLEEAQARAGEASARVEDLTQQTRGLRRDREAQERAVAESRSRFEERLAAAYKGQNLQGIVLLIADLFGDPNQNGVLDSQAIRILKEDRASIHHYEENERLLGQTAWQLDQRKADYAKSRAELRALAEELERREAELEGSINELRGERGRTRGELDELERRIEELEEMEEAGLLDPPASGGGEDPREEELRIADEEIVAEPVEELPLSRYRELYKEAAEDYGFGPDWYVLMAVGKIESNHGENMGPSSAGAMGPMQFLPSTWETAGVDGNGDGVPNMMDPEDAIPAAAKYLADNGAPGDWYAALFAYNRAEWYVREVLEIAEQYRHLAGDDSVGPYGIGDSATGANPTPSYAREPGRAEGGATPATSDAPQEDAEPSAREPETTGDAKEQTAPERQTASPEDTTTPSESQY